MTAAELTPADLASYARYALGQDEFDSLPDETQADVTMALAAAKGYVQSYTGTNFATNTAPELAVAVLTVGAEMLDNRQMTAQYSTQNTMVMQILNLHSENLLPEVEEPEPEPEQEVDEDAGA